MNETVKDVILFFGGLALMALCGCMSDDPEKSRHLDIDGVWTNPKTGTLIAGSIEVQSAPEGVESAMVKYEDDTSLFSDKKKHKINILMTGSNSIQSVTSVVHSICTAFIATAPILAKDGGNPPNPLKDGSIQAMGASPEPSEGRGDLAE